MVELPVGAELVIARHGNHFEVRLSGNRDANAAFAPCGPFPELLLIDLAVLPVAPREIILKLQRIGRKNPWARAGSRHLAMAS
ncbi:hypothetical protein MES5069_70172 [Mesorhizobium escarrei]|uniref:Uncharacterized protein n=1 Tax=Mesorhizobium escarrei TaxID=666018 RepID=A0ABM9EI25_9HYPH|nr:hypothetical protein MES5069_70172 [Mesorhizobium escarrei]